ncbi:MFS transporter [Paraburkholderia saeva]|uniref:MFS-type transporter n=1 Tax=Paraburkholderia saeva TaxID=2777537 RepID=A0A9N8RTC7_9BURK|nr:MFS transporter [Paraburkholderia saeva]CAG4890983.1 putative MFS-type transporter [Paraburkholderia saeva]CAG4894261.1 putative MFS-type transporter [Paraburkholderia saeva]CAG4924119.1 putative MFS-type transporter [Paraburkholderia saeva]
MSGHLSSDNSSERARGHRWKVLGVGFAANASFSAAFSGIPTTAVFIRSGYHVDNHVLGLLFGMLGLGIAVSELPWGVLTDRWGDRRVLLLGLVLTAAALAAMAVFVSPHGAYVPGVPVLAAGLLLVGLLGGSVNGSSGRAVMAWFREGERGLAMSIRQTAVPAGGGLGALVLPALAAWHGFACVYGVLAVLCAVTAGFAWRWLHEPPAAEGVAHATHEDTHTAHKPAPQTSPLRDVRIWRTALGMGVLCVPQLTVVTFATVFLHDFGRAGLLTISLTMAAVQTGAAVMRVWSGHWTDRHGNRRVYMRACSLVTALLFAPLAVLTAGVGASHTAMALVFAVMIALGGVSASAWHGVAFTELATLAGTRRAGTALAIGNTCVFMTMFLTPLAIPLVLSLGSWPLVWAMGSLCALIALPVFPRAAAARGATPARA